MSLKQESGKMQDKFLLRAKLLASKFCYNHFMDNKETITLKAMCVFEKDGKVFVSKGFDKVKKETFYRFLGGHINFFETGEEGIRREIQEELGSKIENLKLIETMENLFTYQGEKGHEIDFLYSGDLVNKKLYTQNPIHVMDTQEFDAEWVSLTDIFKQGIPLYPRYNYQ